MLSFSGIRPVVELGGVEGVYQFMRAFLYRVGFSSCTHSVELVTARDGFNTGCVISIPLFVHCPGRWFASFGSITRFTVQPYFLTMNQRGWIGIGEAVPWAKCSQGAVVIWSGSLRYFHGLLEFRSLRRASLLARGTISLLGLLCSPLNCTSRDC